MNKALKKQQGVFLVTLLLNISIVTILAAGAIGCYFTLCRMHRDFVGNMIVQEQLRFAAGNLLKDLASAKSVKIENSRLSIFMGDPAGKKIVYEIKGENLMKDKQPVTGNDKDSAVVIEKFSCKIFKKNVILICIKARDKSNMHTFSIETGAFLSFGTNE